MFDNNERIAHYNNYAAVNCIAGMVYEKHKAMEHPYPTLADKIEKYGYDGKQLSHCARLFEFLERYLCGIPLEECYISTMPQTLMNYKKQLTKDGSRIMTKEEAIELCETYDNATKTVTLSYIETTDETVSKIKIEMCDDENLKLNFDGEIRSFVKEK